MKLNAVSNLPNFSKYMFIFIFDRIAVFLWRGKNIISFTTKYDAYIELVPPQTDVNAILLVRNFEKIKKDFYHGELILAVREVAALEEVFSNPQKITCVFNYANIADETELFYSKTNAYSIDTHTLSIMPTKQKQLYKNILIRTAGSAYLEQTTFRFDITAPSLERWDYEYGTKVFDMIITYTFRCDAITAFLISWLAHIRDVKSFLLELRNIVGGLETLFGRLPSIMTE